MSTLTTLHRDEHLIVVDKPAGLLIHPNAYDWKSPTCLSLVEQMTGKKGYTVHRLDRGTSGVLVLALDATTAAALALAFRERKVEKRYIALVRGFVDDAGEVDSPIKRGPDAPEAPALTLYRAIGRVELQVPIGPHPTARYSLVSLDLKTGRLHQARRHMHRINHPVVGDKRHGDRDHNRYFRERFGLEYLFLRAVGIVFPDPVGGGRIDVWAGLPDYWRQVLAGIALEIPPELERPPQVRRIEE